MRTLFFALCLCLPGLHLSALDASLSYATFKAPGQTYIEIYLHLMGQTITYQPAGKDQQQAKVEVIILFKEGDRIVKADKYLLSSPLSERPVDLVDLKRYALANGTYTLEVVLTDQNRPENQKSYSTKVVMDYAEERVQVSDLQLLAQVSRSQEQHPLVKNGLLMEPLPFNFYGRSANVLTFYTEVYDLHLYPVEGAQLSFWIEDAKPKDGTDRTLIIGHRELDAQPIVPVLMRMNISSLSSGSFILRVQVRDKGKKILDEKSLFFQRSNPELALDTANIRLEEEFVSDLNEEELEYCLEAVFPKLDDERNAYVNTILRQKRYRDQRMFIYTYFAEKDPTNPQRGYEEYMAMARQVDEMFYSGFRHGFETDRGYIYLKYGPPNDIEHREEEPSAPPYQVWSYYKFPATGQNNVKFIFYNFSLAPGDFQLLHSTAIGEVNNPQWQMFMYRNSMGEFEGNTFDNPQIPDNFNRNAKRVLNDY
jgi:GWxTD domain-containing protein